MFTTDDTIVAVATPPGRGGIGVVRLSGPQAHGIAQRLTNRASALAPRHATFCRLDGIDQVVVTFFPAPRSYTGDDVVEIGAHGSPVILRAIVEAAIARGARLAEPGEFTLRAMLNGRIDLMQAEAVADLIDAATPLQARAAFDQLEGTLTRAIGGIDASLFDLIARLEASVDFPEEGYHFVDRAPLVDALDEIVDRMRALLAEARRGRLIREGLQIAIVGRPNVGKSSLFNALVGASRAIVTDIAGTTRDMVTEVVDFEGLRVTLVDTAGLRDAIDPIEAEGVARTRQAIAASDLVIQVVCDDEPQDIDNKHVIARNKSDLHAASGAAGGIATAVVSTAIDVSALTRAGLDDLRGAILDALDVERRRDGAAITNVRHIALVERARDALLRARTAASAEGGALPEEFVLADLQDARAALEEITGRRTSDDLLAHIFSRFCIGK